jgi:integrase
MTKRREHGDGGIDERGPGTFRLRYRINRKRYSVTFKGTRAEAKAELRRLIRSGDMGAHVAPDRMTVAEWIKHWIEIGAPGRNKAKRAGRRTIERYEQLLNVHVVPVIGSVRLQELTPAEVEQLYRGLRDRIAQLTQSHVHRVLNACLISAFRKGCVAANPIERVEDVPAPGESNHGQVLDEEQLAALVQGFQGSTLFPIVAVAAFTGARRNEILALRWSDLDLDTNTLRIERAIEETKQAGRTLKAPKTERGTRSIEIDEGLAELLRAERDKHLRLVAGIPTGTSVDLSLVRLPPGALMFPSSAGEIDLTRLRDPHAVTRMFSKHARALGFPGLRFHDLRGSHETILLDKNVPVHVVATRCGHDPAVLLRVYAKRTKKADRSAASVIGGLSKAALS